MQFQQCRNTISARNLGQQPAVRAVNIFASSLRRARSLRTCRTSSFCPSCTAICAGSLRKCRLPEFWGQDRTKTRGCGHDTASNFARTYNDWVGLSDFNRPTFADHRRGHKSCQTTGNFLAHVDGLEKWGVENLRWWAPQEACEEIPQLFCSPPGLNHAAQSRQPMPLLRKSYLNDFQGSSERSKNRGVVKKLILVAF